MSRTKDKKKFFLHHPLCCLCGGENNATTVEHAPPLSLFVNRDAKGAFRFPACKRCNEGSRNQDHVAALATLIMGGATASHVSEDYLDFVLQGVKNNQPEVLLLFEPKANAEYLSINRLIREVYKADVDRSLQRDWLDPWAAKQALAFWYQHTGKILPKEGGLFVHWIPNAQFDEHKEFFDLFSNADLQFGSMRQGDVSYDAQFSYRFSLSQDKSYGTFFFSYHDSCLVWCGVFEKIADAMRYRKLPILKTGPRSGIEFHSYPIG